MESVLCFRCGGDVPADQRWCGYCAAPVVAVAPAPPPAPAPPLPGPALTFGPAPSGVRGDRTVPIVAAVVAVLLAAGVVVLGVARFTGDGPESVAEHYFDALADGDAGTALDLVAAVDRAAPERFPLLSDAALADERFRPRAVRVGESTTSVYGTRFRQVPVRYRAGDQTVSQDVVLEADADQRWRLRSPFVLLAVLGQIGREVTVNGVGLGVATATTTAFPGSYEAVAAGNRLLADVRGTAVPQPTGGGTNQAVIQFGVPELAAGALDDIRAQVRAGLDKCAASSEARPAGCPFGLDIPGTAATVQWAIVTYPVVQAMPGSQLFTTAAVGLGDDGSGRLHWSAAYTDYSGTKKSESGDSAFRIAGSAQAVPNGIQVSLT
jgi:hypothetical protein